MAETQTRQKYDLRLLDNGQTLEITIYDFIVYPPAFFEGEVTALMIVQQLADAPDAQSIVININSGGGAAFEAFAIYNALNRHKAKKTVNIDGLAASAASVVAMVGDVINMGENAMLMIHQPITIAIGDAADMRKEADILDKMTETLVSTYVARSGRNAAEVREWVMAETWFTAAEAKAAGLVDNVTPAKRIAASYDLSRFKHVPPQLAAQVHSTRTAPPTPNDGDQTTMDKPTLASIKDIENACPGADAAFVTDQLRAEATVENARAAWTTTLAARLEARDTELATVRSEHATALAAKDDEIRKLNEKLAAVKLGVTDDDSPSGSAGDDPAAKQHATLVNRLGPGLARFAASIKIPTAPTNN